MNSCGGHYDDPQPQHAPSRLVDGILPLFGWHCQTNLSRPAKGADPRRSGRQLTPFGQGGGTVLFEDVAAIEVAVLIEMIMDRGVDGGKLLQSLYVPDLTPKVQAEIAPVTVDESYIPKST